MAAELVIKKGTGHRCRICHKPVLKTQVQIHFFGWNASCLIHSDPKDCNVEARTRLNTK
jgi:hypothetical protein